MPHTLNRFIKSLFYKSRLYKLGRLNNRFYILTYHMIADQPNGFFPEEYFCNFMKHVEYLKKHFTVLSLEDIAKRVFDRKSLRRCVAITFDDGFRDNYVKAYPVLKSLGVPATVFLTTGCILSGETPWFIRFRSAFMNTTETCLEIELDHGPAVFSMPGRLERRAASDQLMHYLQTCPNQRRLSVLDQIFSKLGAVETDSLMLNWEQIKEMGANGISFGAHTVTHPVLSKIPIETLYSEIESSKTCIENMTGRSVKTFAYPFGRRNHYPAEAPQILKKLGFCCAVTTEPGANAADTDMYQWKRSSPWELSFV